MNPQTTNDALAHATVLPLPEVMVSEDVLRTAERLGIKEQLPQVVAISRALFGDPIVLRVTEDPEIEDWSHIVVHAVPKGTVEETVAKEESWCDRMVEHRLSRWFTLMDD